MSHRRFEDRNGDGWEVREVSSRKWHFEPLPGNDQMKKFVRPPSRVDDSFELSEQELQKLLDSGKPTQGVTETPPSPPSVEEEGEES